MIFTIVNVNAMASSRVDRLDPLGQVDAYSLKTSILPFLTGSEEHLAGELSSMRCRGTDRHCDF